MTTTCEKCGKELVIGEFPFCPHGIGVGGVVDDSIPGGILIKNGLCHADGTPRRFDHKSDIKKAAKAAGLTNYVQHVPSQGSDKSRHTQRFV